MGRTSSSVKYSNATSESQIRSYVSNVVITVRTQDSEVFTHSDRPSKVGAILDIAGDEFDILGKGFSPVLRMTSSTGEAQKS